MDLVRDLLDKRVVDRNGLGMGRVDTIVLRVPDAGAPVVTGIEIGASTVARRLHPVLGRIVEGLEHAFGIDSGRPVRIPIERILSIDDDVKVDVAAGETAALVVEQRLRRWVRTIPGG